MKIKYYINIGLVGCQQEGVIEIEDDATDEQIEAEAREAAFEHVDWSWEKID